MIAGIRNSGCERHVYLHNDLMHRESLLAAAPADAHDEEVWAGSRGIVRQPQPDAAAAFTRPPGRSRRTAALMRLVVSLTQHCQRSSTKLR